MYVCMICAKEANNWVGVDVGIGVWVSLVGVAMDGGWAGQDNVGGAA